MDHMDYRADIIYRFLELAVPYQPLAGDARPQRPYQQQIKRPQFSSPEKPVDGQNSGDEVRRQPGQRQLKRPRFPPQKGLSNDGTLGTKEKDTILSVSHTEEKEDLQGTSSKHKGKTSRHSNCPLLIRPDILLAGMCLEATR